MRGPLEKDGKRPNLKSFAKSKQAALVFDEYMKEKHPEEFQRRALPLDLPTPEEVEEEEMRVSVEELDSLVKCDNFFTDGVLSLS